MARRDTVFLFNDIALKFRENSTAFLEDDRSAPLEKHQDRRQIPFIWRVTARFEKLNELGC